MSCIGPVRSVRSVRPSSCTDRHAAGRLGRRLGGGCGADRGGVRPLTVLFFLCLIPSLPYTVAWRVASFFGRPSSRPNQRAGSGCSPRGPWRRSHSSSNQNSGSRRRTPTLGLLIAVRGVESRGATIARDVPALPGPCHLRPRHFLDGLHRGRRLHDAGKYRGVADLLFHAALRQDVVGT